MSEITLPFVKNLPDQQTEGVHILRWLILVCRVIWGLGFVVIHNPLQCLWRGTINDRQESRLAVVLVFIHASQLTKMHRDPRYVVYKAGSWCYLGLPIWLLLARLYEPQTHFSV